MSGTETRYGKTDLLRRTSGGVDVTLVWDSLTRSLTLELVDHTVNRVTEFDVPHDRASYAFHHPFAYGHEIRQRDRRLAA